MHYGSYELVGLIKLDMATERAVSGCGANARAPDNTNSASFIVLGLPGGRERRRNLLQSARSLVAPPEEGSLLK